MTLTTSFSPGWYSPTFSPIYIPELPTLSLTEDQRRLISQLQMKSYREHHWMMLTDAYYRGMQVLTSLGIAVPPELDGLRILVGWPKIAVDPFVERLILDCFRIASSTKADETLADMWLVNGMGAEQSVANLEALVMGRSWYTVGTGDDPEIPRICVESPLNMTANWDIASRKPREVLQTYWQGGARHAALYQPGSSIFMAEDDEHVWQIVDRDDHGFDFCPVVRQANRPRANDRDGSSEITPELMSIVDAACRTLLNMSVSGEFYSVPQKLLLGVAKDAFVKADGSSSNAWSAYVSRILTLDRDEEGKLPEVHQFQAYDPSVFTKVIEMYASQAAGILGAPPQDLGLYTQGNPVSAEAAQVSEARRDRRARRMQANFGVSLVEVAQMAMKFANGGDLPAGYDKLAADWQDPQMPNFTGMADGISKLVGEGVFPRRSDVLLRKLGLTEVERRQMAQEHDDAQEFVAEVGKSVAGKAARSTNALETVAANAAAPAVPAAPAPPA